MELLPRIRICALTPGAAELDTTCTPGVFPTRAVDTAVTGAALALRSSDVTEAIDPVTSLLRVVPYPTATTSSSWTATGASDSETLEVCPALTVTERVA